MKTTGTLLALSLLAASPAAHAQFTTADIQYWVGTGADSSVLVVDFRDESFDGTSYAWGYLHDGNVTAEQMLNDIAQADVNFDVDISGGFLNDITYGTHAGIGAEPDWWSTWSGTDIASMAMNGGISASLSNGDWFGCSYGFNPVQAPTEPFAAFEPFRFTANDVVHWVGNGANSAVLIVDFHDGEAITSYAWGYRFDGTTDGEAMLNAVADADPAFEVVIVGGFLNDITYAGHAGLGGEPDYWGTWSGTNLGNWSMNDGIGTVVMDGDLFGCSYTDFEPALRPGYPVAAPDVSTGVAENVRPGLQVWPVPATDVLHVNTGSEATLVTVYDLAGNRVYMEDIGAGQRTIDVSAWSAGLYVLQAGSARHTLVVQ